LVGARFEIDGRCVLGKDHGFLMAVVACMALSPGLALTDPRRPARSDVSPHSESSPMAVLEPNGPAAAQPERTKPWHFDLGWRTSIPRLQWTDQMLDRRLDLPLKLDWLGVFDHPETPLDRKTDLKLGSVFFGIGRTESEHILWSIYGGAGADSDATNQRFLATTLDVRFRYGFYYLGALMEYYPWKIPQPASADGPDGRLRSGRPFLFTGLDTAYISGSGKGDYRIAGQLIYRDAVHVRDWLVNVPVGLGWSAPLSARWSLIIMGGYRFHFYRPEEYNGWDIATQLRCRIGDR
jgi:hypothetical protein